MTSRACRTKRRPRAYTSPNPKILTLDDLRLRLGFRSRHAVYTFLANHPDFPEGKAPLQANGYKRWLADPVDAWLAAFWSSPSEEKRSA